MKPTTPAFDELAPNSADITDYDRRHIKLDMRLLDASADGAAWSVRKLDFRGPGSTRVSLSGAGAQSTDTFKAGLSIDSADPDALVTWLQGRSDLAFRSQKPLRLRGEVDAGPHNMAIAGMKAEFDGGTVEGRVALSSLRPDGGLRVEADLKSERLDLDAAAALLRSLGGPQAFFQAEDGIRDKAT